MSSARMCSLGMCSHPNFVSPICPISQCIGQLRKSECPTCRAKVSGKGALPVNIDLMRIVNVLSAEYANETHFVCASHAKRGKSYFCLECWAVCCADCIIFGGHRKHDVQRADSISGALLDTIRDQARVVLADSSGLRDGLQVLLSSAVCSRAALSCDHTHHLTLPWRRWQPRACRKKGAASGARSSCPPLQHS